jgi:hypothetical protein
MFECLNEISGGSVPFMNDIRGPLYKNFSVYACQVAPNILTRFPTLKSKADSDKHSFTWQQRKLT